MCKKFRPTAPMAILALCCAFSPLLAAEKPATPQPSEAASKKPRVMVTISKETTYIVSPLRSDGYPDYVAALNEYASQGVTPENNAAVLLWQAMGPKAIPEKAREEFFRKLGIPPLPEKGDYFITFDEFVRGLQAHEDDVPEDRKTLRSSVDGEDQFRQASERPWAGKEFPVVANWLEANKEPLRLVAEAAQRPRFYSPEVSENPDALVWQVFHSECSARELFALRRALLLRANSHAGEGRIDAAWRDIAACHRFARALTHRPAILDQAIDGMLLDASAHHASWAMAHYCRLAPGQVRSCLDGLRQLPEHPAPAEAFGFGERLMCLDAVCAAPRSLSKETASPKGADGLSSFEALFDALRHVTGDPLIDWDRMLRIVNGYYDRAQQLADRRTFKEANAAANQFEKEIRALRARDEKAKSLLGEVLGGKTPRAATSEHFAYRFVNLLTPPTSASLTLRFDGATRMHLTQLALALSAHRTEHGSYPDSLAQLVPAYFAALPRDVYAGAEYKYRREGEGYLLYGLGPNGKDDGGHGLYMTAIPEGGEDEARPEGSDDVGFRIAGSVPEKPKTVRVAAIQFISRFAKPAENRKGLEPLIREAAKNGAKIVVLPETAISAYASTDLKTTWQLPGWKMTEGLKGVSPKDVAETVPGESTRVFGALAKELGIYLTVPFVEVDPKQDKYFNTIVLVGPDGRMLLHYRKLNPWPWAERGWATKGDRGHQFIDTPYGRLGLLVCYDINFEPPTLKKNRVDHLLYCIAWVDLPRSDWFPKRLPEIARKNDINIIGANWSVPEPQPWHGWGHTLILSREGKTLATVNNDVGNEIIYADLPVPGKRESGDRSQESGEEESRLSLRESSAARLSRSERRQYIKHQSRSYHNVRQRAPS